jgi:hypothetical protein
LKKTYVDEHTNAHPGTSVHTYVIVCNEHTKHTEHTCWNNPKILVK